MAATAVVPRGAEIRTVRAMVATHSGVEVTHGRGGAHGSDQRWHCAVGLDGRRLRDLFSRRHARGLWPTPDGPPSLDTRLAGEAI